MNPTQLSHELREEQTPDLTRRRWMIGLSLLGVAAGQIVSMYQTGILKHLPDPPVDVFDSDKVDASDYAYKRLETPDAFMMIVNYGITAWLAAAGGKNRAASRPWLPIATAVKAIADTALDVQLAREEWQENKALCAYCQAATVISAATVALAVPEAIKAIRNL